MAENSTLAEHLNSTDDEDYQHPNTEYQLTPLENERTQAEPTGSDATKPNKANLISSYLKSGSTSSSNQSNAATGAKSGQLSSSSSPPS